MRRRVTRVDLDGRGASVDIVELPGREGCLLVLADRTRPIDPVSDIDEDDTDPGSPTRRGLDTRVVASLEIAEADEIGAYFLGKHVRARHRMELRLHSGSFITITPQGQAFELEVAELRTISVYRSCLLRAGQATTIGLALRRHHIDWPAPDDSAAPAQPIGEADTTPVDVPLPPSRSRTDG